MINEDVGTRIKPFEDLLIWLHVDLPISEYNHIVKRITMLYYCFSPLSLTLLKKRNLYFESGYKYFDK